MRCSEVRVVYRIRICVFRAQKGGIVEDEMPAANGIGAGNVGFRADLLAERRGPGAQHGILAVDAQRTVDQAERAPGTVVARAQHGDCAGRIGECARAQHAAGRDGVVAPEQRVVRAVRVAGPESLRVAVVAVHVLPAVVEDASVGEDGGVPLEERRSADLVDVRAVGLHLEEVAHDVAVAHAVLRLTRGGENDVAALAGARVERAHRAVRDVLCLVDLAALEEGLGVVVVWTPHRVRSCLRN